MMTVRNCKLKQVNHEGLLVLREKPLLLFYYRLIFRNRKEKLVFFKEVKNVF